MNILWAGTCKREGSHEWEQQVPKPQDGSVLRVCVKTRKEFCVVSMEYTVGKREKSRLDLVDPEG